MRELRIDGDVICYTAGFAADSRGGDLSHSLYNSKLIIDSIIKKFKPCEVRVFLTSSKAEHNFRNQLVDDYKANRLGRKKPTYYKQIRKYLINKYKAEVVKWGEADDALCADATEETIIASKDKDLLMVPATHYRIHTEEIVYSSDPGDLRIVKKLVGSKKQPKKIIEGYGFKWFTYQMLQGDIVDNIHKPVKGFGPLAIYNLLNPLNDVLSLWGVVCEFYDKSDNLDKLMTNAQLLWISRKDKQKFDMDVLLQLGNSQYGEKSSSQE